MLIVTQVAAYADGPAGVHGVLGQATTALTQLAEGARLTPVVVDDVRDLSPRHLDSAAVLSLFTIGETPFSPAQRDALHASWRDGRLGVLGVHSATDACHTWPEYGSVIGARFDGHPWTQDFTIDVVDPDHPATSHLGDTWAWHDEIYLFRALRPDARVLLTPGRRPGGPLGSRRSNTRVWVPPGLVPCRGSRPHLLQRSGSFSGAWETPTYLRHLAGGLAWLHERA